jgi:hypothetical protein
MHGQGSLGRFAALSFAGAALACSVQVDPEPGTAETGSTRAVIAVTRSAPAASPDDARADAFAGFVRTVGDADPRAALRLAGLGLDLPAVGECRRGTRADAPASTGLAAFELLDAGEVTLVAGGAVTTLAPRAFPTITDSISGVVYTTRDRAAAPLPAASSYTLATTGGSALEAVSGIAQAPALLDGVELAGEPFETIETAPAGRELALRWSPGSAGDRVYVELVGSAEPSTCAFADESGAGTIPASALPAQGWAAVSIHRLREATFSDPGLAQGALRFDFELSGSVTFE